MKNLLLLLIIILPFTIYAQEIPLVKYDDSLQLKLSALKIDVKIIGNFATTTYDMKFYNQSDRTLEAELSFPLGQGQSVSGFSMDVNGKMRDAVIVEKELARVAFESTVRQHIDPGLLEKTQGNNYKARVYPILPRSDKHIIITYEQELFSVNDHKVYELPLGFKESLDSFSVDVDVYGDNSPLVTDDLLNFHQKDGKYHASISKENYIPFHPILIHIPDTIGSRRFLTYDNFFYINQKLTPDSIIKKKPKKITILWDASFSLAHKKLEKELELLNLYLTYLQDVEVQFISFNNSMVLQETFIVNNGEWSALKKEIENIQYDGGTSLNFLNTLKPKSNEIILFTDGLTNLGGYNLSGKKTMYVVNSSISGDHELMNSMATSSGGSYINVTRYNSKEAFEILKHETFQFLGVKENKNIEEVYPNMNVNVVSDFSITGKFSKSTTIKLLFGYQNKPEIEIEVPITTDISNEKIVKRLWSKQKLQSLNIHKKENKKAIVSLAKQYHLITDYTSMLILDRVEDYVRYRIEPPNELKAAYKERIANIEEEELYKKEEIEERKEELLEDYEDILKWYTTKFPKKKKRVKRDVRAGEVDTNQNTAQSSHANAAISDADQNTTENSNPVVKTNINTIDATKRIISGQVVDERGLPLPGVSVIIKDTATGTQTDFDGNFSINIERGQELEFSYVGFQSTSIVINDSDTISISLQEDLSELEEVVVTGYAVQKKSSITASVTSVQAESLTETLAGVVNGVNVSKAPGASPTIRVRGASSASDAHPLYIIDGVPVEGNPVSQLPPDGIESMQILKESSAVALYGSRASNGIIIITTKKGKESNSKDIEKLHQKIADKIELKPWNPDTPYIKTLRKEKTVDLAYSKYLEIRNDYTNVPSFYLDVADFFDQKEASDIAIRVLTNLIESDLDNHELMRGLAYKLEYFNQYELAVVVYKKILELRPEEPQSYRDLALAYEYIGEFQKSFDLLYKIYKGELLYKDEDERFYGIEHLAYVELNRLVYKYKKELHLSHEQKSAFTETPVDIRIVIDWNHNDTDIDLWVIDPNNEKGYYSNADTEIGGRLSEDIIEGYGPEEFMLKNAIKGNYQVMIDYYADNVQKISGPTILKITVFKNYGKENESRKISVAKLDKEEDELEVGNLKF